MIHSTPFDKDKYSIGEVHGYCDGAERAHVHANRVWNPTMYCLPHGRFSDCQYSFSFNRKALYEFGTTIFISCPKMKFLTPSYIGEKNSDQQMSRDCYVLSLKGKSGQINQIGNVKIMF
jgi:hypothetical protein